LDAGDVRGEEMDAVTVQVASGAVVVLGGAGVGVSGEDLGVAGRHDASGRCCRSGCQLPSLMIGASLLVAAMAWGGRSGRRGTLSAVGQAGVKRSGS
jgi:hypothetical protein